MQIIENTIGYLSKIPLQTSAVILFITAYIAEFSAARFHRIIIHVRNETIQNFAIGAISFSLEFLIASCSYPMLHWLFEHARILHFNNQTILSWVLLFVFLDFLEYLFHFACHKINLLWAAHIVHHQSPSFNLSVGFRTSFFIYFFNIFFYALLPVLGFAPQHVFILIVVQGTYQLLIHTKLIGRLGLLEYVLLTPSSHRVHHGCNDAYLDKNFGKVLIIWDLLFGTYVAETEEVQYGVKNDPPTKGSIDALFKPFLSLFSDARKRDGNYEKIRSLFGKP